MVNTHFITPHGLDDENHYTTAYELALITDYALNNDVFRDIVGTKLYTVNINGYPKSISNTNELLGNLSGVYGVKTGFTSNAGRCLVTATKNDNGLDIITIVLGADTKKIRTNDSINLINYCLNNYRLIDISSLVNEKFKYFKTYIEPYIIINKGIPDEKIDCCFSDLKYNSYPVKNNDSDNIKISIDNDNTLNAPVYSGDSIGCISVYINNELLFASNILVSNDIKKKDFLYYLKDFFTYYKIY